MVFNQTTGDCRNTWSSTANVTASGLLKTLYACDNYDDSIVDEGLAIAATPTDLVLCAYSSDGPYTLRAVNLSGEVVWNSGALPEEPWWVATDGTSAFCIAESFGRVSYLCGGSLSTDGDLFVNQSFGTEYVHTATLGDDGNLYVLVADGYATYNVTATYLYSFSAATGAQNFKVSLPQFGSAPEYLDGGAVCYGTDGLVYVLGRFSNGYNTVGSCCVWTINPATQDLAVCFELPTTSVYTDFALDADNNMYLVTTVVPRLLMKYSSAGVKLWEAAIVTNYGEGIAVLGDSRVIYSGTVFDANDGSVLFTPMEPGTVDTPLTVNYAVGCPNCDFILAGEGVVQCYDTTYALKWRHVFGEWADSPSIVLSNGGIVQIVWHDAANRYSYLSYFPPSVSVTPTVTFEVQ